MQKIKTQSEKIFLTTILLTIFTLGFFAFSSEVSAEGECRGVVSYLPTLPIL